MKDANPKAIHLKDYRQPDYLIRKTHLEVDLYDEACRVTSRLEVVRNPTEDKGKVGNAPLILAGQELELVSVVLNERKLDELDYRVDEESLTIYGLGESDVVEVVTLIKPQENTSLEGLYRSQSMYCTQCEAEGFRKITYYLDRPDVMSEFTTRISADKNRFPTLLSNGNLIDQGELNDGRHFAVWHDPFKKPCYLFALVGGDLACVEDTFSTMSGRNVAIKVFVEQKDLDKCDHAINALKNAMRWDEEVYGREYDLDIFMIVAVDDFNMGAMENKGLNIFNTSCVLAKKETTSDAGFQRVEGVVAHEYFHNWSGNRVTCRDWFQLSLKEGFTVFRDQEFSADMGSPTVKRVEDVSTLRAMQFAEDAGPMAHPVQPSSFIEISNFYTLTIYEKGAEIVRMIRTLIGAELFRKGADLYFEKYDGQAVTVDDFVGAMADASGRDFSQFMNWYRQAGTPELSVSDSYDKDKKTYTLRFKQYCRPTAECENKLPYHIPVALGLLGDAGGLPLKLKGKEPNPKCTDNTHIVVEVKDAEQEFIFENIEEKPVPSLLRGFSSPVKLNYAFSRDDLMRLMSRDEDGFCRWDASQKLAVAVIEEVAQALVNEPAPAVDNRLIEALRVLLDDDRLDPAMVALMLQMPSENYLAELAATVDVDSIHHARNRVRRKIAQSLEHEFLDVYRKLAMTLAAEKNYSLKAESIAKRSLKNTVLQYLVLGGKDEALDLCLAQFHTATNMTDELSALTAIVHSSKSAVRDTQAEAIDTFYHKWKDETLVMNSWFSVQASRPQPDALVRLKALMKHEAFDAMNPNKIRSLIGTFAMRNPVNFHSLKGDGYQFLGDQIIRLNSVNPQIASRLITPLTKWKRYDDARQAMMRKQLERISVEPKLSKDVYEVVSKSLGNA